MKTFTNKFSSAGIAIIFLSYGLITIAIFLGCSKSLIKGEKDFRKSNNANIAYLLKLVEKINSNSPQSFSANFSVEGHLGKQNYKTSGNAQYNNNPRRMRVVFHDAVFKSAITYIVQEEDAIRFFFPFDKILYIDNIKKINLKSYANFNLDFELISDLSIGRIPVIKNFSSVKGFEDDSSPGTLNNKFIILENNEYYETISFMNDIPDKILWLNKSTKEKIEVYLNKPAVKENILFYNIIRIVSLSSDLKITIQFDSPKFNIPVDLKDMVKIKLPSDTRVVKVNSGN